MQHRVANISSWLAFEHLVRVSALTHISAWLTHISAAPA